MMKNTYILGMAKSPLALKSGQSRSLELDFFKLAFAVAKLRSEGHNAFGYFQVIATGPQRRIDGWVKKYDVGNTVQVLCYVPTAAEQRRLEQEKMANREGLMGAGITLKNGKRASDASYGKKLVERALVRDMKRRHSNVPEIKNCPLNKQPANTKWDYYGTLSSQQGPSSLDEPFTDQ